MFVCVFVCMSTTFSIHQDQCYRHFNLPAQAQAKKLIEMHSTHMIPDTELDYHFHCSNLL